MSVAVMQRLGLHRVATLDEQSADVARATARALGMRLLLERVLARPDVLRP